MLVPKKSLPSGVDLEWVYAQCCGGASCFSGGCACVYQGAWPVEVYVCGGACGEAISQQFSSGCASVRACVEVCVRRGNKRRTLVFTGSTHVSISAPWSKRAHTAGIMRRTQTAGFISLSDALRMHHATMHEASNSVWIGTSDMVSKQTTKSFQNTLNSKNPAKPSLHRASAEKGGGTETFQRIWVDSSQQQLTQPPQLEPHRRTRSRFTSAHPLSRHQSKPS